MRSLFGGEVLGKRRVNYLCDLFLIALAVSFCGCAAGYGSVVANPDAAVILADRDHLSAYRLYVFGDPDNPSALAGLIDDYRMESDVWKLVYPGVLQPERITRWGYRKGYDILAPDGKTIGVLSSNFSRFSVKVDTSAKTVVIAPFPRGS